MNLSPLKKTKKKRNNKRIKRRYLSHEFLNDLGNIWTEEILYGNTTLRFSSGTREIEI